MVDFWQNKSKGSRVDTVVALEDFSDRLNSVYTSLFLLLLAAITLANVYFIRPIFCSIPTLPKDDFTSYAESVCWSQGTTGSNRINENVVPPRAFDTPFYQWVPFCLLGQAILFYLPRLIWWALSNSSFGDNFGYLIARAKAAAVTKEVISRAILVRACADHLYLLSRQQFSASTNACWRFQERLCSNPSCRRPCAMKKRMFSHLTVYYILVKILYIANCIGQILLAGSFLGRNMSMMGFSEQLNGGQEYGSSLFPRAGHCVFRTPGLGVQSQIHTITCTLPVNVLNERIYLFLWVWILAVLTISGIMMLIWIRRLLMRTHRNSFMRSYLYVSLLAPPYFKASEVVKAGDVMIGSGAYQNSSLNSPLVERFLTEVVGCDGNFLIRILILNAGFVVTGEILVTWWRIFKAIEDVESGGEALGIEPLPARTAAETPEADLADKMIGRTVSYI